MPAAGLDFSDDRIRIILLDETKQGLEVVHHDHVLIPDGVVHSGRIEKEDEFVALLQTLRSKIKTPFVRVSIPEFQGYSFMTGVEAFSHKEIRSTLDLLLEENIPLSIDDAIFDYSVIEQLPDKTIIQVVAVSHVLQKSYQQAITKAGFIPVSFELEGHAIARGIIPRNKEDSFMIVDMGQSRTGITIVTRQKTVFTATLDFGGEQLTRAISKTFNISFEEAEKLKKIYGFSTQGEDVRVYEAMIGSLATLKDEINRHYVYWHDKKNQIVPFEKIETIYLCGGNSNLVSIDDYLRSGLKLNIVQGNPWVNMFSLDDVVPRISQEDAVGFTTAIGLALADFYHD